MIFFNLNLVFLFLYSIRASMLFKASSQYMEKHTLGGRAFLKVKFAARFVLPLPAGKQCLPAAGVMKRCEEYAASSLLSVI